MLDLQALDAGLIPRQFLTDLQPVLQQAKRELQRELSDFIRDAPNGANRWTATNKRNAMAMIDRFLKRVDGFDQVQDVVVELLSDQAIEEGALAATHAEAQLARLMAIFDGAAHPIALREAAVVARGTKFLIPQYPTSAARYAGAMADDIRRVIALGFAKNETFAETTKRLVGMGGPRGAVAVRGVAGDQLAIVEHIPEGLFRRYGFWAERLVRTEAMQAYNAVHLESLTEFHKDDDELVTMWDASNDSRVCRFCQRFDEQIVAIGSEFTGIGVTHPPAHPNCRCVLVPWKRRWSR